MNVFDFFGRNSFAPSIVLFATALSASQREFIVLKGNVEVRADFFDELRVIRASVQPVMKCAEFEDVERMPTTKTGKGRVTFDFFVEHHAGTVRTFTGTTQRANETRSPRRLNYPVRFEFVRGNSINGLNRRGGNFFDLLFGLFHFITPLNLETKKGRHSDECRLEKTKKSCKVCRFIVE